MGNAEQNMSNLDNSCFSLYYVAPPETAATPLHIDMAGDEQCAPTYRVYRSPAEISVLILVLSGDGRLELHGRTHTLRGGDLLALPQGETYGYEASRAQPWRILWFNMTGPLFPHWLSQYGLLSAPVYPQVQPEIVQAVWAGINLCRSGMPHDQLQDALCAQIYSTLLALRRQFHACARPAGPAQELRFFIDELITAQPDAAFSMAEAAAQLNLSQRQLERRFTEAFHRTPYRYFLEQKLLLAKQYLRNTRLSVKEISQRLGFCDPYYFSNCFKREEGVSPRAYRQA